MADILRYFTVNCKSFVKDCAVASTVSRNFLKYIYWYMGAVRFIPEGLEKYTCIKLDLVLRADFSYMMNSKSLYSKPYFTQVYYPHQKYTYTIFLYQWVFFHKGTNT